MNTKNLFWYRKILTVLALLVFAGATAVAEVPSAPSDIYAMCSPDGQGGRAIDVVWMYGNTVGGFDDDVDGFYLYQSINSGSFQRVATVENEKEGWGGFARVPVTELGTYTFYATAYNDDGEGQPSYEASVVVPEAWIEFQGEQPIYAAVESGEEFTHTFTATASNGGEVRYFAGPGSNHWGIEIPCTIDAVTGEFKTTVDEDGYYTFPIIAYLADDSTVYTMTTVDLTVGDGGGKPNEPELCATISGSIVDAEGNVVNRGFVSAFPADQNNWFSTGAIVVDGQYEMLVPEGSYYVVYQSERGDFFQFHPQSYTMEEATAVDVACNESATANFELLENLGTEVTITVSGRVTRESDGSGVLSQVVFFDNSAYGCGGNVISVMTDENGNYEAVLPIQYGPWTYSYIGMAMSMEDPGLAYEYYQETSDPAQAVVINEASDAINFTLSGLPTFNGTISGTITDGENNPVEATVLAFSDNPVVFFPMFGVVETTNGAYTLQNLAAGNYYIVVLPHAANMPGYYAGIGQNVTMNWEEAQMLELAEDATLTGIDMVVPKIEAEGINVVDGQASQKSGSIGKGEDVQGAEPLNGVMLYAIDENGDVVGSTVSSQNGQFQLTGFGTGTYRIYADKLGFLSHESTVTFDQAAGNRKTVDVTLQPNATTGVSDPVLNNVGFSTFPNPVTSQLSVRFTSLANTVRVSVSDIAGKELIARDVQTAHGENTVQLDLGNLSAGAYIVTLKAENSVLTAPVTVVR